MYGKEVSISYFLSQFSEMEEYFKSWYFSLIMRLCKENHFLKIEPFKKPFNWALQKRWLFKKWLEKREDHKKLSQNNRKEML